MNHFLVLLKPMRINERNLQSLFKTSIIDFEKECFQENAEYTGFLLSSRMLLKQVKNLFTYGFVKWSSAG